jgi:hypothetical protein
MLPSSRRRVVALRSTSRRLCARPAIAVTGVLAALVIAGCGSADNAAARNTVVPMQELPFAEEGAPDPGIGVLAFREEWSDTAAADTLTLWTGPRSGEPWARFVWTLDQVGGWYYSVEQVENGNALRAAILEYGYEIAGLPIDSVDATVNAALVIYGYDAGGNPERAWARLTSNLDVIRWDEHLPQQALYFRDERQAVLYDAPDGRAIEFALPEWDYQLIPDSVDGDWMRVHASTPHFCSGDPAERETTAWIRFLDERRRPTVWYYTRGC